MGGSSLFALRPQQHQRPTSPASNSTKWPRFAMQASAYHATLGFLCKPLFAMRATVCQADLCMPYSPWFTIQSSVYRIPLCLPIRPLLTMRCSVSFAGRCLPCSHLFTVHSSAYRTAPCKPYHNTPLLYQLFASQAIIPQQARYFTLKRMTFQLAFFSSRE